MGQCIELRGIPGSARRSRCTYDGLWNGRCYRCDKDHAGLFEPLPPRGKTEEEQLRFLLDEWGISPAWMVSG